MKAIFWFLAATAAVPMVLGLSGNRHLAVIAWTIGIGLYIIHASREAMK